MNDIVSGIDMALGSGWDRLETYRGESFRWVTNDAVLYVATLKRLDYQVQLQIEPGPGVGLRPFTLKVSESDGKILASVAVKGRHHVSFTIPAGEPKVHAITLRTNEGGKPSPNDPRVLNFRIFKVLTNALPGDVLAPASGFRLGTGWYPLESFSGETFRWVNNDAIVEATGNGTDPLELELEPGPGVELRPFALTVFDSDGERVESFTIRGRQRVAIELPNGARAPLTLRLHVEGGGKTTSEDARVMNFRVFEYSPNAAGAVPALATVTPLKPVAPLAASQ